MKKEEMEIGKEYVANHNGHCQVRLDAITHYNPPVGKRMTRFECTKLSTGRRIVFRSALKFIRKVTV